MSWLGGNENTSLWTDVTSFWHNATTGELTDAQKAEIATATTQQYTPCSQDMTQPQCQSLYDQITKDVNIVAPNTDCKLRLSDSFCFQSWSSVSLAAVAVIFGFFLIYGIATSYVLRGGTK